MKTVFLCTPIKLGDLNHELAERIEKLGFKVKYAHKHTPQDMVRNELFESNISLIKSSDIFVAVLKDYGKDLTAEVGMAYAWGMPTIGINYNADPADVMCYHAIDKIIKPEQLEETLNEYTD